ncbi:ATP-dependent nuclease [Burkholderia cepacia]|uniref:ATP-dependent nuclease n=1 Tax=Burkholderia cepacia TaxID=292 RepID=UPI000F55CCE7|nr:ATP-dependent endonuclease [Burkholderia cepacia]RQT86911.1 ATP-dependent endonuclease [Burkholderia cepacia]RQU06565.1 ATP-dependent endonuclease [Burkholderia cepacia]RQZ83317.1 ATP-dependent endonuclease [Burkholderia cepacia]RRA07255.1 ATP-dependent endonuclease [Burkholderia cepacia]RRA11236.1 ATP-dependent endonuclease [Burkholderia cepacia]
MRVEKVRVEGFRLLQDVEIMLEDNSTVIVGRNNSGKTSFTDIFDRFTGETGARFRLEDFSAAQRERFFTAKTLREQAAKPEDVLAALPTLSLTLTFRYDGTAPNLGPLAPFVIDLDVDSTTAIVRVEYRPVLAALHTLLDIPPAPKGVEPRTHFFRSLRDTLPKAYSIHVSAIDPTDDTNRRDFEGTAALSALLQCNFVRAQRTLDHAKHGDADVIGKLLSALFKTASAPTAATTDQELAAKLKASVEDIERNVQSDFDEMLKKLLPAMEVLGFPSLNDTELRPETSLNVEALLSDHTKVVYTGTDGVHLPEGYNGLGTRNLIYMLLQLESYHKAYRAKATRPASHLIFIEEPEAHLHPQMQEVFINQLNAAIGKLSASYPEEAAWNVQFVITTHSPHVANATSFEAVRYFLNEPPTQVNARQTKVKDFKKGMSSISSDDQDFLHQYMTLTKCDLYFADKAIMVEGTTERLLMPRLCELVDKSLDDKHKLARQYVTCVEVGGAYAHIFYPLLDFLELKTLVVTDLDSTKPVEKQNKKGTTITTWDKCPVADGQRTSNAAIKEWFRPKDTQDKDDWQITPAELVAKTAAEKQSGYRRIAFQIPEKPDTNVCARSYEDALVLANPDRFEWPKEQDEATEAWEIAKGLAKADTALRFAIREKAWTVPRYIQEGLAWLSEPPPPPMQNVEAPAKGAAV